MSKIGQILEMLSEKAPNPADNIELVGKEDKTGKTTKFEVRVRLITPSNEEKSEDYQWFYYNVYAKNRQEAEKLVRRYLEDEIMTEDDVIKTINVQ